MSKLISILVFFKFIKLSFEFKIVKCFSKIDLPGYEKSNVIPVMEIEFEAGCDNNPFINIKKNMAQILSRGYMIEIYSIFTHVYLRAIPVTRIHLI